MRLARNAACLHMCCAFFEHLTGKAACRLLAMQRFMLQASRATSVPGALCETLCGGWRTEATLWRLASR